MKMGWNEITRNLIITFGANRLVINLSRHIDARYSEGNAKQIIFKYDLIKMGDIMHY